MTALDEVRCVWTIPGRNPAHHEREKARLRTEWPLLARAIERLIGTEIRELQAKAWAEGHRTRWRRGPDECRCGAWDAGECACGAYGTGPLLSLEDNPYRKKETTP